MKKNCAFLILIFAIQLLHANLCNAQITTLNLKPAPENVTIDGSLKEWGDSLSYYNSETGLNYALANDKDNLYLVLKTSDPVEQSKILTSGITLSIDTKGKKKSTYSVTFPVQEGIVPPSVAGNTLQEKKLEAGLAKLKKIKADGFKDVEYDFITLENTYGFKIAINYDDHGFLVYEEAIPLTLFHADELKKNEWMFNIKINGFQKPEKKDGDDQANNSSMGGGGRGGRGGGGGRGGAGGGGRGGAGGGSGGHGRGAANDDAASNNPAFKSADFWGKFNLAKTL
ncbi:hypothetical protein [Mucilaginibacter sp.]|uniref:hypothetical protein n=1 Tax=Mucilaginibacter sp. TaxID=1882438 RepID=UPI00261FF4D7|nr:hypothetical protein [Mucilaginibacter sp.]MDB4925712.1 hypothetical protein [Mucilaginibacter sp.]